MVFMYEVVEVWGDVPEAISSMVGSPDQRLMYPENRGIRSTQDYMKKYQPAGGWAMERRGAAITGADNKIDRYIDETIVAAEFDDKDRCEHLSATGVDDDDLKDPEKVWECDTCGWRYRSVKDARGISREVPA
jgi:hypothetical protein